MAFSTRTLSGHMRQGSTNSNSNMQSTGQSAVLLARVNEKKAELENLKELRNLSAAVADQMEALQQKLATLSDGTEAIATVVGNWHNVLQAINMASAKIPAPSQQTAEDGQTTTEDSEVPLPQTLVRIPTEHAPALQAQAELAMDDDNEQSAPAPGS
ncbi:dash complex subunit [Nemania sp. FL0916]|nr:dash complex subunit [Nemania sp. FL0916]